MRVPYTLKLQAIYNFRLVLFSKQIFSLPEYLLLLNYINMRDSFHQMPSISFTYNLLPIKNTNIKFIL